jgi:TPP-dependent pyruvate/acetoin dehydrogenase alpha subunit
LKKTENYCCFTGEGATSREGDFHEALNIASVWELPVPFVIENNGYGLSTLQMSNIAVKTLLKEKDTEWKVILLMEQYSGGYNLLSELKKA